MILRRGRIHSQTWLSLSGWFSTHILGRWASDRLMDSWNPSGPNTCPGSTLTTALHAVLWGVRVHLRQLVAYVKLGIEKAL